jgi:hypothetical protein
MAKTSYFRAASVLVGMLAAAVIATVIMTVPAWAASTLFVSDVSPDGGTTNVAADSDITAEFSKAMKARTIKVSTFYLKEEGSSTAVPAEVSYSGDSETATLDPEGTLDAGSTYTATIKGGKRGVRALDGDKLGGTSDSTATFANRTVRWSFTVASDSPPPPSTSLHFSPNPLDLSYTYSCLLFDIPGPGRTELLTIDNSENTEDVTVASVELTDTTHFFDGAILAAPFTVGAGTTIFDQITFRGDGDFSATLTFKDENGDVIDEPVTLEGSASCFLPPPIIVG